jgi:hypothetical protein
MQYQSSSCAFRTNAVFSVTREECAVEFHLLAGTRMTDCVACTVFQTRLNEWTAHLENGAAGPFKECGIALEIAVAEVQRLRRSGRPARLVIMTHDGRVLEISCLCQRFVDELSIMDRPVSTAKISPSA